ncbi:MAG: DUF1801 domain-containing protein [Inhella sp.]
MASKEAKTKRNDASVRDLIALQSAARHADCQRVIELMQAASGRPPEMWGAVIIGFGAYQLRSGKRVDEWPIIGFSPRKQDLVLYIMNGYEAKAEALARLGKHRIGKSCLYLKRLADVDQEVLLGLIERGVARMAERRIR